MWMFFAGMAGSLFVLAGACLMAHFSMKKAESVKAQMRADEHPNNAPLRRLIGSYISTMKQMGAPERLNFLDLCVADDSPDPILPGVKEWTITVRPKGNRDLHGVLHDLQFALRRSLEDRDDMLGVIKGEGEVDLEEGWIEDWERACSTHQKLLDHSPLPTHQCSD